MSAKSAAFTVRNVRTGEVLVDVDLQAVKTPYDEDATQNKEVVAQSAKTDAMNDTLSLLTAAQRESYAFFGRFMQNAPAAAGGDEASHNEEDDDKDSLNGQSSEWSVDNTRDESERIRAKRARTE